MYDLAVVTGPTAEPVTLAEAKAHLRVDWAAEDVVIDHYLRAARELSEEYSGRRWLTQTLRLTLQHWPYDQDDYVERVGYCVRIPVWPVQSVSGVQYYDAGGVQQTLDPALWQTWLGHRPPLVAPAPLVVWPATQTGKLGAVQVTFVAGYANAAAVPRQVAQAIKLTAGYWYGFRGDGGDPTKLGLPAGAVRLLDSINDSGYR